MPQPFNQSEIKKSLRIKAGPVSIFHFAKLPKIGMPDITLLPFSIKVLLESAVRNCDNNSSHMIHHGIFMRNLIEIFFDK